ncbi:MAG: hypothetical protein IT371_20955 [Deltaproteobacteria bacterium]|nr:hypothetical protein [Deltaproteobacteria bacterium]
MTPRLRSSFLFVLSSLGALVLAAPARAEDRAAAARPSRPVLMSIQPGMAEAILVEGVKRFEIRKQRPGWGEGTPVLVYSSSERGPKGRLAHKSVVGVFQTGRILSGSAMKLWLTLGSLMGTTYDGLDWYLDGGVGYAIEARHPRRLQAPTSLDEMRRLLPGFRPPQSYQYVREEQRTLMDAIAMAQRGGVRPEPFGTGGEPGDDAPVVDGPEVPRADGARQLFVYSPSYTFRREGDALHTVAHTKPAEVLRALEAQGLVAQDRVHRPAELRLEDLLRVHTARYAGAVVSGGPNALSQGFRGAWTPEVARHALSVAGGTYAAAKLALEQGTIVGNLAPGSHHAKVHTGGGFGTFNGPVVAARKLLANRLAQRVLIVDGDIHFGGGTNDLTMGDPRIGYLSVYGVPTEQPFETVTNRPRPVPRGATDSEYLAIFSQELKQMVERFRPQVIIYNAGADPYHDDPVNEGVGLKVSRGGLKLRDAFLFALARSKGIPVAWELGGGYAAERGRLTEIHVNTAEAANEVLAHVRAGDRVAVDGVDAERWHVGGGVARFPRWEVAEGRRNQIFGTPPVKVSRDGLARYVQKRDRILEPTAQELTAAQEAFADFFAGRVPRRRQAQAEDVQDFFPQ